MKNPPLQIRTPKIISDPLYGPIDIRPVLSIVDTEQFQLLGERHQLGAAHVVFPSAQHTRKAHSFGVYYQTLEMARRWMDLGFIGEEEMHALADFGLCHDLGHAPFSHLSECFFEPPGPKEMSVNSRMSIAHIREIRAAIEECGVDFDLVLSLAEHRNPLHLAVSDKNLGADKLDYLQRDGRVTILSDPSGLEFLRRHIYFVNGTIAIDEKAVDNAKDVQVFYLRMYESVYFRKAALIAERMIQKMLYVMFAAGELSPREFPDLTDAEVLGRISVSQTGIAQALYRRFRKRELFKEALIVMPERFIKAYRTSTKPVALFGATEEEMGRLAKHPALIGKDQDLLAMIERNIAGIANVPEDAILVTGVSGNGKLKSQDVKIYDARTGRLSSLKERHPSHFESMEEFALSHAALRVCTPPEHRTAVSNPSCAKRIRALLSEIVSTTSS